MSLFKKLFGKKKKEPALSASESILKLQETESLLLKKQKNLEEKIAEEQETAKQNASKNKRGNENSLHFNRFLSRKFYF